MWEYLTVFVLAATPLLELLVVIPLGIGYGLDPIGVALVTLLGNTLPVLGIVVAFERWQSWRQRRGAARPGPTAGTEEARHADARNADTRDADPRDATAPDAVEDAPPASARWRRAQRLWVRYGTPGLALLAPLLTGVHLATIAALALGSPRRAVAGWMVGSICLWTIGVTVVTVRGIEAIRHAF
jgi:hypothetical protein